MMINKTSLYFWLTCAILISIAGFRPVGIDRDSLSYFEFLNFFSQDHNFFLKEPGFTLIVYLNEYIFGGNFQAFLFIFALIGVTLKMIAIKRLSILPFASILVYFSLYFVLHEMTQIRAGVASAIFLISLQDIVNKEPKAYFIKCFIAICFHFSSVIMIPLYFINHDRINRPIYFFLPILGLIFSQLLSIEMMVTFLSKFSPGFIVSIITAYKNSADMGGQEVGKLFNPFYLSILFFYFTILSHVNLMQSRVDILCTKIISYSLFLFAAFISFPVLAFRISEFLGVVLIFLLPHSLLLFKQKKLALLILGVWLLFYFVFIMIGQNLTFS